MTSTFRITREQQDSRIRSAETRVLVWKSLQTAYAEFPELTNLEMLTALGEVQTSLLQQMLKDQNSPVDTNKDGD